MALTLVTGPANSGKAGEMIDWLRERSRQTPLLVVPTDADAAAYRMELARKGAGFGVEVMRFAQLSDLIAERVGLDMPRVGGVQRTLVIASAIKRTKLKLLTDSAARPGFIQAAGNLFQELARGMVEPGELRKALSDWAADAPRRGLRRTYAREVAALYENYRLQLDEVGRLDHDLFTWQALVGLRGARERWGNQPVGFYGFDDLTPVQLQIVSELAAATEVIVTLPHEDGRRALKARDRTFTALISLTDSQHHQLKPRDSYYAEEARPVLHHLERHLFEEAGPGDEHAPPTDSAVRWLNAGSPRAELELVSAEILSLIRSGTAPDGIAVVYRSPSQYASLVNQVFGSAGIPYSMDLSIPLEYTPLGRGFMALIRAALTDRRAQDLIEYLRIAQGAGDQHPVDELERNCRRRGIESAAKARRAWESVPGNRRLDEIDTLTEAAGRSTAGSNAYGRASAARTTAGLVHELRRQVDRLFGIHFHRMGHIFTEDDLDYPHTYRQLITALAEAAELMRPDSGVELSTADLMSTFQELTVHMDPGERRGRVQVLDPYAIRARRCEHLFICGLQEGEFPRRAQSEPFFTDEERRKLRALGVDLPEHEEQLDEERYLFYMCASRPERGLALCTRTANEEGKAELRSFFIDDVADILGDLPIARERLLGDVTWQPWDAPTARELARSLAARPAGERELLLESTPVDTTDAKRIGQAIDTARSRCVTPSRLTFGPVCERLASNNTFAAREIETYAGCPMKWLIDHLVRPDQLEPDSAALVRGICAHAALKETFVELGEGVTEDNLEKARERIEHHLDTKLQEFHAVMSSARLKAEASKLRSELSRLMEEEAEIGLGLNPEYLELAFGSDSGDGDEDRKPLPPLELPGTDLKIRGRIDRVDVGEGMALVRDYKTGGYGGSKWSWKKWLAGLQIQVAIYALAVERLLDLELAGAVYQPIGAMDGAKPRGLLIDSPRSKGALEDGNWTRTDWASESDRQALFEKVEALIVLVTQGIRDGLLEEVADGDHLCSDGCYFPSVCRRKPRKRTES